MYFLSSRLRSKSWETAGWLISQVPSSSTLLFLKDLEEPPPRKGQARITRTEHSFRQPTKSRGISLHRQQCQFLTASGAAPGLGSGTTPLCWWGNSRGRKHQNKTSEGSCPRTSSSQLTSTLTRGRFHPAHSATPGNHKLWLEKCSPDPLGQGGWTEKSDGMHAMTKNTTSQKHLNKCTYMHMHVVEAGGFTENILNFPAVRWKKW